jgi:N-acetylmuramoyl-L-alanine amidase
MIRKRILTIAIIASLAFGMLSIFSVGASDTQNATSFDALETEAAKSETRAIPSGSYAINLNVNGRQVLKGRVFNLNGITYVPMFAFADWLGMFTYSYNANTATARVEGENLEITAHAGDLYIVANDRYFYTGREVVQLGGEIYVPILPLTKALNSRVSWRDDINGFYVSSGDTRLLKKGSQVYREDEVFWLARIITAEAGGEPMNGKLAVGNVVLNRVRSAAYPNTIYGVIFDRKYGIQFSPVANGTIYNVPTEDAVIAAKMCLEGYSLSSDILYFVNPTKAPDSWIAKNRKYAFSIGNHAFFE